MIDYRGLKLPDGEMHLQHIMEVDKDKLMFRGKPTYQFRKFKEAFRYATRFDHAVDIGSHVGLWTRVLVQFFETVTCFEPIKEFRQCFEYNIEKWDRDRVTLHPFALGEKKQNVFMTRKKDSSGDTHIIANGMENVTDTVEMRTLDSFKLERIDFLKIDCEGYEANVLRGGEKTIRRDMPVVIVEQKESTKNRYGLKFKEACDLLQSWGALHECEFGGDHILRWNMKGR